MSKSTTTSDKEAPVFIVGAGPSGLAAGWRLSKFGRPAVILESSDRVGGQLWTIRENGFTIEAGTVILPSAYEAVVNLVREAGLMSELVITNQTVGFIRDGKISYIHADSLITDFLKSDLLSLKAKLRLARIGIDALRYRNMCSYEDLSMASQIDTETPEGYCKRHGFPDEVYDYLVSPTVKSMLGVRADRISVAEFFFIWQKILGTKLYVFQNGYSTFPETLASTLDVRKNCTVREVIEEGNRVRVTWTDADGKSKTEYGAGCIITSYGNVVPDIMPQLDKDNVDFLKHLEFSSALNIIFGLSRPPAGIAASVITIPDSVDPGWNALVFQHNQAQGRVPDGKGLCSILATVEWSVKHFDDADDVIAKHAAEVIDRVVPGFSQDIEFSRVYRWHPILCYSHPGLYKKLGRFMVRRPNGRIQLAGSYFSSGCVNTAVVAGELAVRRILPKL
jgi:oxygen-dependent protoporphyrinogen oxidase